MSTRTIRWGIATCVCVAIVATGACTNGTGLPTAPPPPAPVAAPPPPPPPPPVLKASVEISINPNPVGFSGLPITDSAGCVGSKNTWFYQQNLKESGGVAVTVTSRIDKFDARIVNTVNNLNLSIPAMGTMTIQSRWCSAQAVSHTAQSSFSGTDANGNTFTVDGPVVSLKSP
jgi:hypothetical protein